RMSRLPARIFLSALAVAALIAAVAVQGQAGAQEASRGGRVSPGGRPPVGSPSASFGQQARPASPQPVQPGQPLRPAGSTEQPRPQGAVSGQTAGRVDPPAKFADAVKNQNQARSLLGLAPLVWSTAREDEARAAVSAITGAPSCTRTSASRVGAEKDV